MVPVTCSRAGVGGAMDVVTVTGRQRAGTGNQRQPHSQCWSRRAVGRATLHPLSSQVNVNSYSVNSASEKEASSSRL